MIKLFILHDVDKQLIVVFDWFILIVRLSLFSGFPLFKIRLLRI